MPAQCPVCRGIMYEDSTSDGVFLRCGNCNHKHIKIKNHAPQKKAETTNPERG